MNLQFAFLADAATIQEEGTFAVIKGGYDTVWTDVFPKVVPVIVFIGRIIFEPAECGQLHRFSLDILDQHGQPIDTPQMRGTITPPLNLRHPERPSWMTLCLNYQGLTFQRPGDYTFRLTIDERQIGGVTIEAARQENPA